MIQILFENPLKYLSGVVVIIDNVVILLIILTVIQTRSSTRGVFITKRSEILHYTLRTAVRIRRSGLILHCTPTSKILIYIAITNA